MRPHIMNPNGRQQERLRLVGLAKSAENSESVPEKRTAQMAHEAPLRPLIAGNWKMNGSVAALAEALAVRDRLREPGFAPG